MKNVSTPGKSDYEDNFYMHHIKLISPNFKAVGDPKSDLKGGQFGRPSDLQKLFVRSFCPLCKVNRANGLLQTLMQELLSQVRTKPQLRQVLQTS